MIENQWTNVLKQGKKVEIKIKIKYNADKLRPHSFEIEYKIDGTLYNPPPIINN